MNINVNGKTAEFDHSKHKTLLEALEQQGFEPHYHCRDGFCGACRCKLLKGEIKYAVEPLAFIRDDEILTCCSQPLTDIELDLLG